MKMRPAVSNNEMVHIDVFAYDGRHETHSGILILTYGEWSAFKDVMTDANTTVMWGRKEGSSNLKPDGLKNDHHQIDIKEYEE